MTNNIWVVIPAFNEQKYIDETLRGLRSAGFSQIVVVDDGSSDQTVEISKRYADKVIERHENLGRSIALAQGFEAAVGDIIVNIDSDVLVAPNTLSLISEYFLKHDEVDAVTGLLSSEHPSSRFFSQYKNLYMHYVFRRSV